jgi:hypothetical protein
MTEDIGESVSDCSESITNCPADPRVGAVGLEYTGGQIDAKVAVGVVVDVEVPVAVVVSVAVAVAVSVAVAVGVIDLVDVYVAVVTSVAVDVSVAVRVTVAVVDLVTVNIAVGTVEFAGGTGLEFHFPQPATVLNNSNVKSNTPLNLTEDIFIWFHPSVFL